jgi:hypothetical protein
MKSLLKILAFGIAFLSLAPAFAQQNGLSTQIIYFNDTSSLGAADSVHVRITNLDTGAYSGYINIYYSTDTVTYSPVQFCTISNIMLNGLDSVDQTCTINFDSVYFHTGDNIVVVWSSGGAKAAADSVRRHIYLKTSTAGIHEDGLASLFTVYPTLANNYLFLESSRAVLPEKIFITDVSGRIVSAPTTTADSKNRMRIQTGNLKAGVYFLHAILPDKSRFISKFVKAE